VNLHIAGKELLYRSALNELAAISIPCNSSEFIDPPSLT
jgi:hypothetical protein